MKTSDLSPVPLPATFAERLIRGNVMTAECPSREILKHLTSRWGALVVIALMPGKQRFSELRHCIGGVSERMLAQTLQLLEADGMVERKDFKTVPPHVEYTLTPIGCEAAEKIHGLVDWLETKLPSILETRSVTT
ncbi:helix-turn-helix domain-containing protein [Massilia sp.]|uniref:winged helix-turn-helix transcriptional regulator n=1 Tax=Massilia sp. TaxID=1882437 RepID=UPI0028969562|nr:helix-turn-helix domain-containing protein [Massilia sp.]